ncbi:phage protein [Evansella cellulosilytica DSM 2522]|uniref:Phage protein n=2 Tax=Evansella TaxID=2837485 RepID=E6U1K3_EVAC2|nr:phage protein [Evansella cellulosilytica DSM 2522]
MEAHNERLKNDYEMQRNVIYNAIINANRKKNSRIVPLFPKDEEKSTEEIIDEREELFGENVRI